MVGTNTCKLYIERYLNEHYLHPVNTENHTKNSLHFAYLPFVFPAEPKQNLSKGRELIVCGPEKRIMWPSKLSPHAPKVILLVLQYIYIYIARRTLAAYFFSLEALDVFIFVMVKFVELEDNKNFVE